MPEGASHTPTPVPSDSVLRIVNDRHENSSELADLIERYLDGDLDEAARAALEARFEAEPDARAELTEALATRALVEMTLRDERRGEAESCLRARDLVPRYHQGLLDAPSVGYVARHLDECEECASWYESHQRRGVGHRKVAKTLAALGLLVVTVVVTALVIFGDTPTRTELIFRTFVPFDTGEKMSVSEFLRNSDVDGAVSYVDGIAADWLDRLQGDTSVQKELDGFGIARDDRIERRTVALLLAWSLSRNVRPDWRGDGLACIRSRVGAAAEPFFHRLALETEDPEEFHHAVTYSVSGTVMPDEAEWLLRMWDRAINKGFTKPMAFILDGLASLDRPETVEMCWDVLAGRVGHFDGERFPTAAHYILEAAARAEDSELSERLIAYATTEGDFPLGRARALECLHETTKDERFRKALHAFLEHPDRYARRVAFRSATKGLEVSLEFLERFVKDPDPVIREEAKVARAVLSRQDENDKERDKREQTAVPGSRGRSGR